ncbi:MAG: aryl-sulfate sulfotransferase [Solirubrobacterales bacterium]|nr:aryl-sulfate sulfotransferase [Solirubrobacterales bacterium]
MTLLVSLLGGCAWGITRTAENVGPGSATVTGLVAETSDSLVNYWFEYGPTKNYGYETTHRSTNLAAGKTQAVSEDLADLNPGSKYHFRLCAKEPDGTQSLKVCGADDSFTTGGEPSDLAIHLYPGLQPEFDPDVFDYVTRCTTDPITVDISAPADTTVAVDGDEARSGTFTEDLQLSAGKSFELAIDDGSGTSTYYVRCLPVDFPAFSWTNPGDPSANFYIVTPRNVLTPSGASAGDYVTVFDDQGVPIWWMKSSSPMDAKMLADHTLAWGRPSANGFEIHDLDGTLLKTWRPVGVPVDLHDFQALPNGNVLIGSYPVRPGTTDLSAFGGPATNGTLIDAEIQEIRPDGSVAWSWNVKDHIELSETPNRWRGEIYGQPRLQPDGRESYDWAHWNSLQKVGDMLILSFRHLDAVYAVDMASGDIVWKLGGTSRPESLTVLDDPESNPFSGQHYARILPNGDLTLHDNNTHEVAPPRAAQYGLDLSTGTATLLDSVSDPDVTASPCCGSATRLEDGSWLASWGGTAVVSEFGSDHSRHFKLQFTPKAGSLGMSYRVDAITDSSPTIAAFRDGMNAMP